jgi:hypothetical protein
MSDGIGSGWHSGERKITIGLDFDDTFTADPELWTQFVALARSRGHKVVCVSCRTDNDENRAEVDVPGALTYLTSLSPKAWYMNRHGIDVDVWIDDHPECVAHGR